MRKHLHQRSSSAKTIASIKAWPCLSDKLKQDNERSEGNGLSVLLSGSKVGEAKS